MTCQRNAAKIPSPGNLDPDILTPGFATEPTEGQTSETYYSCLVLLKETGKKWAKTFPPCKSVWHIVSVYGIGVTHAKYCWGLASGIHKTLTQTEHYLKQVQQDEPPCRASREWPPAHLCGFLLLASPLEPFHVIDLIHLDLKRLFQRSWHRRQVHPLACGARLLPQGRGVWQGCRDKPSSLEAYKAKNLVRQAPVTLVTYSSSIYWNLWLNIYESHCEM